MAVVDQFGIDLVRNDEQVVLFHDARDLLQVVLLHDCAGRVVRIGKDQELGTGGDCFFEAVGRQAEIVLLVGRYRDRRSAGKHDARRIGNIAGVRNEDLIPVGHQGPQGEIDGFGRADCYQDLGVPVIGQLIAAFQVQADLLPKLRQAAVGGVLGFAVHEGIDRGVADHVRGFEIRLADAQGDRVLPGRSQVKKAADPAWRHGGNPRVQVLIIVHGEITSLRSASSFSKTTPSSL